MSDLQVSLAEPLSEQELDLLSYVAISSGIIGIVCFVVVFGMALFVSIKTNLPGRNHILASFILLAAFIGFEQYMGGNLEWVYGPVANLYKVIIYCTILLIFSVGYLKSAKSHANGKDH